MQVQVLKKDGTTHKLNPDYLLEIKQEKECYSTGTRCNPCIGCKHRYTTDSYQLDYCHGVDENGVAVYPRCTR